MHDRRKRAPQRRACGLLAAGAAIAAWLTFTVPTPAQADPRFDACMARCAPEDAYHCGHWCGNAYTAWKWRQLQSGRDPDAAQPARLSKRPPAKVAATSVKTSTYPIEMFSGSESRLATMSLVNADCSQGPIPEIRIVTKPASGEVRLEPVKSPLSKAPKHPHYHCNGKIVDGVAVYYKSKEQFVGTDMLVIDVNSKLGSIWRYTYNIDIR